MPSSTRCQKFLYEFANLNRNDVGRAKWLVERYPEFLPWKLKQFSGVPETLWRGPGDAASRPTENSELIGRLLPILLGDVHRLLLEAWTRDTEAARRHGLTVILGRYAEMASPSDRSPAHPLPRRLDSPLPSAPPDDPFQGVLEYARAKARYMRRCANPDCAAPYFLAARVTQTVCGETTCADFARRQAKRRWWSEKGSEARRKARRKK